MQLKGEWVRWTSYDLLNSVIVRAAGSKLESYDAWAPYAANVGKYRTVEQPYTSLLELARKLRDAESRGVHPSALGWRAQQSEPIQGAKTEVDQLVLDWCNQYGLLGLVSVRCGSITVNRDVRHFRDGGQWFTRLVEREVSQGLMSITKTYLQHGEHSVSPNVAVRDEPTCTWLDWKSHEFKDKPLNDLEVFFRRASSDQPLCVPRPNTVEFWGQYGEPLIDFIDSCKDFAASVAFMSRWQGGAQADDAAELARVQQGHRYLSGLAKATGLESQFDSRAATLREDRFSAGLFASFGLMFLLDWQEGRRALECRNCASWFVSNDHRAGYCSPRCRNTAQSRRYRNKATGNYKTPRSNYRKHYRQSGDDGIEE